MNFQGNMTGCPNNTCPTSTNCYNVVSTCNVEEALHYTNYHTHQVNNCIKRHINIPVYSTSEETKIINEYVEGAPVYQAPTYVPGYTEYNQAPYMNQGSMNPGYMQPEYQGNVRTQGAQSATNTGMPFSGFNPFGM